MRVKFLLGWSSGILVSGNCSSTRTKHKAGVEMVVDVDNSVVGFRYGGGIGNEQQWWLVVAWVVIALSCSC